MAFLSVCRSSFSRISKGTDFTFLLVAVALLNSNAVESSRDLTITAKGEWPGDPNITGVWNDDFKAANSCIMFHYLNVSVYFFLWPEPDFKFCCGHGLRNYTYTTYGPRLQTTIYHDVGPVDICLPYWKCGTQSNWRRLTEYVTFLIPCEKSDMQRLYSKRLRRVIGLNGLVQTALPWVVILELGVFLAIVALSSSDSWRTASAQSRGWRQVLSLLCRRNYANNIANLVHLCVLVVIGNCFMEATRHSNPYKWESGMFFNWAQFYLFAPSILTVAMFFHQTADWGAARNSIKDVNAPLNEDDVAEIFVPVSEDWMWQSVVGQLMVLVLTGYYCVYNSDDHRTAFVSFVLGVAVVFCIWSVIFSLALLLGSVKCLHENLRLSRPSLQPAESAPLLEGKQIRATLEHLWNAFVTKTRF